MTLAGKFVLVAGSADPAASPERLSEAARYVREIVATIVHAGGGVVVFTAAPEPVSRSGHQLIFDWIALEEVARVAAPGAVAAVAVTSAKVRGRMTVERGALLDRLVASGAVRLVMIADDVHTGGNIGDAQVAEAFAMVAIGGGRGVVDRAAKLMRKGGIVVPVDARVGAASADGKGSETLYQQALANPERFAPFGTQALRDALPVLGVHSATSDLAVKATLAVLTQAHHEQDAARAPDVLLLTALPVELEAVQQTLEIASDPRKTANGTNVWSVDVSSRLSARSLRTAVACLGAAGNVSAAATTSELVTLFRPHLVVMVGIAAGIRGKCLIGDVVLSERVTAYEAAAITAPRGAWGWIRRLLGAGSREPRPEMYRLAHAIEQDVTAYLAAGDALITRLTTRLRALGVSAPSGTDVATEVRPRLATIASGEKLLRDPRVLAGLRGELHGRIELGEMEAAGIAEACRRLRTDFLIVRGVSDFGDNKKADNAHRLASASAAAVCADFLREGLMIQQSQAPAT